jgi:hypothetical protein
MEHFGSFISGIESVTKKTTVVVEDYGIGFLVRSEEVSGPVVFDKSRDKAVSKFIDYLGQMYAFLDSAFITYKYREHLKAQKDTNKALQLALTDYNNKGLNHRLEYKFA